MNVLKVFIESEYFDQIAAKEKTVEYRKRGPFWESRLKDADGNRRQYDRIEFINGYSPQSRRMLTGYEGFYTRHNLYCIKVGKIYKRPYRPT